MNKVGSFSPSLPCMLRDLRTWVRNYARFEQTMLELACIADKPFADEPKSLEGATVVPRRTPATVDSIDLAMHDFDVMAFMDIVTIFVIVLNVLAAMLIDHLVDCANVTSGNAGR